MFITRYCAGFLVWASLILYFAVMIALGVICYQKSIEYRNAGDKDNQETLKILAIVLWS